MKDDVMGKAVLAKTLQNADVRELLLSTGDAKIIEHNKNDNYWADGGDGTGKNMLGIILMEIRDQLTMESPHNKLKDLKQTLSSIAPHNRKLLFLSKTPTNELIGKRFRT